MREPAISDMRVLADEAAAALRPFCDRPVALFGHSMGALLGFEVARRLQHELDHDLVHFFVSGRRAPHLPSRRRDYHPLSDAELVGVLHSMGGTPDVVLREPELVALLLPIVRADFKALETHVHAPASKLHCPITAFCGQGDPEVEEWELAQWSQHTDGPFAAHVFPGGHFYLHQQERGSLLRRIAERLV